LDRIFIEQRGESVQPRVVQRVVERYTQQAGLDDVTPRTCCHAFAKELLNSGASPLEVAKLLGHSRLDSTACYTQPSEEDLMNAVERIRNILFPMFILLRSI
jgi:site-specific recombinase XerD